jgi:microsomal dipeptidase-like Zn-dependent dipeptidase
MNQLALHDDLIVIDGLQHHGQEPDRADLEALGAGGVTAVHTTVAIWERSEHAITNIAQWHRTIRENADIICLGLTTDDIRVAKATGKTAIILGFQNTAPIEDNLDLVDVFWRLGVRIIQLTYNTQNSVAAGCWEPDDRGLTAYVGRSVVRELNAFGILIDASHSTDQTVLDTIEVSAHPIAITHANPRSFVGDNVELPRRNRSDHVLKELAASGGIIGLSTYPKIAPDGKRVSLRRWVEMVEYTVEMIGVDHVGVGTDLYKLPREYILWCRTGNWSRSSPIPLSSTEMPGWIKTPADMPVLTKGLLDRGFAHDDVRKIMGENFLRVLTNTLDVHRAQTFSPVH